MKPKKPSLVQRALPIVAGGVIAAQLLPGKGAKAESAPAATPTSNKPEACEVFEEAPAPVPVEAPRSPSTPLPDFCGSERAETTPFEAPAPKPVGQADDLAPQVTDLFAATSASRPWVATRKAEAANAAIIREVKYPLPGQVTAINESSALGGIYSYRIWIRFIGPTQGAQETLGYFLPQLPSNARSHIEHVVIVAGDGRYNIYDAQSRQWAIAQGEGEMRTVVEQILQGTFQGWVAEEEVYKIPAHIEDTILTDHIIQNMYIDPPPPGQPDPRGFQLTFPSLRVVLQFDNGQTAVYETSPVVYSSTGIPLRSKYDLPLLGYPNQWNLKSWEVGK